MDWAPWEGAGLGAHRAPHTTRTQSEHHAGSRGEMGPHQDWRTGLDFASGGRKGGLSRKLAFAKGTEMRGEMERAGHLGG